ncbi:hypothetical protein SAMN05216566_103401 [Aureimonas phyllosphaerae]|uniref:Uncharacterized protein n=1 Tax=Aureimonas phyllosphaerae TaxID=1166078 RepID=A0A7W6BY73_9HYPH|nr:hypothetical protein [Aureimonas phyllosphaerae]MBB3959869.1 hypothetical protein [Aureimonas phyllosphaerae]SFF15983.1 hypothetical protein SAMN05216566_103401 [Aureimonas phyllosphaerae]
MKHAAPENFENYRSLGPASIAAPTWRQRLSAWWQRIGWDQPTLPATLQADVQPDHPSARPVRCRPDWERRL